MSITIIYYALQKEVMFTFITVFILLISVFILVYFVSFYFIVKFISFPFHQDDLILLQHV